MAEAVLNKGGMCLFDLKDNLADVKNYAEWAFGLERYEKDGYFETAQVRSGKLCLREVETRLPTPELSNDFPAVKQFFAVFALWCEKIREKFVGDRVRHYQPLIPSQAPLQALAGSLGVEAVPTTSAMPSGVKMPVAHATPLKPLLLCVISFSVFFILTLTSKFYVKHDPVMPSPICFLDC